MTLIYLHKIITLNHLEPRCSGSRTVFQPWDLPLTVKQMDWSQAEQGEAEPSRSPVANLPCPASLQRRKDEIGSHLGDFEVQVPQMPTVQDQNWLHHRREAAHGSPGARQHAG